MKMQWKWVLIVGAVVVVAGLAATQLPQLFAQNADSATQETDPSDGVDAVAQAIPFVEGQVIVDARVVPITQTELSFVAGGTVAQVLVGEGEPVAAGDVLIQLDAAQAQTAVSRAEAELRRAQANLANVAAGARSEEIAAATAALEAAQARLRRVSAGSLPNEIAAAQAAVDAANAALRRTLEGPSEQEIISARAELANAEAELQRAQSAYDEVKWRNDIGGLPQSAALQTASNNYEAAQARLSDLLAGPSSADVAQAQAEVNRATAQLGQLQAALPADVAAAQAEVDQLQAQLDLLRAGPRAEEVAVAEADVAAATAALQQALVTLSERTVRAPFGGTVARLEVNAGEQVSAGQVVIELADLTTWEVRTEDLTELEIAGVSPGDSVTVNFDALPDLTLPGRIVRIRPIGGNLRGDIVYTAVVELLEDDPRLLWNMTAVVTFE